MAEAAVAAGWGPLPAELDEAAAALLAECPALGTAAAAGAAIAEMRADADGELFGWLDDGDLIAVYGLRKRGMSYAMPWLAVAPAWRDKRYGRSALSDALRRCGRLPMTIEADETLVGWYQRVGFKIVGRKPQPGGGHRYRLGWYAPRRPDEPGYGAH